MRSVLKSIQRFFQKKSIKEIIFRLCLLFILYIAVEITSIVSLFALTKWKKISYQPIEFQLSERDRQIIHSLIHDQLESKKINAALGWENKPNFRAEWFDRSLNKQRKISYNKQGIRNDSEYSLVPQDHITRILAFGNSFTQGAEVNNEEVWTAQLSTLHSSIEVLNFGVVGYGLDQSYLRYKEEGVRFNPDIVFICFLTENINRHVNVFRPFYVQSPGMPASKPRFILEEGNLKLCENPLSTPSDYRELLDNEKSALKKLGENDFFYQQHYHRGRFDFLPSVRFFKILHWNFIEVPSDERIIKNGIYNTEAEAFRITLKIFELFYNDVESEKALPVILIFPKKKDIYQYRKNNIKSYVPLIEFFKSNDLRFVDLMHAFEKFGHSYDTDDIFGKVHYSPAGNRMVAEYLLQYLEKQGLI